MAKENNQGQQMQISLSPDVAKGVYSNFQIVSHAATEFVVDFATILPGQPQAQVNSRIIMTPQVAKRLLGALNENIQRYENEFGRITEPGGNRGPRTIAPFGTPKGDA